MKITEKLDNSRFGALTQLKVSILLGAESVAFSGESVVFERSNKAMT